MMKILVVDDHPENCYLLETLLKGSGYEVVTASNGIQAIEKLQTNTCAIIISDIMMPEMDGFQFCKWCKSPDSEYRGIPFVFYTATYTSDKDEEFALQLGAQRFIRKPAEPEDFLAQIRTVLKNHTRGNITPTEVAGEGEEDIYKLYSQRLVDKLEKKVLELEQTRQALSESENRYRLLIERLPIAVSIVQDGKIVYASKYTEKITGYSSEELKQLDGFDLIHPDDREIVRSIYSERSKGGAASASYAFRVLHKEGDVRWLDRRSISISWEGKPAVLVLDDDITELHKAEEEKQQLRDRSEVSSRLASVGEMAAGIAHEINNPLTGVIGFSELLAQEDLPENVREHVKYILEGSNRVKEIVKRLLTFARQSKPAKVRLNIHELIDNTLELRSYVLKTANIQIVKDYETGLPTVDVDPGQMQQVFINLIVNAEYAIKQARGGGTLSITTRSGGDTVSICFTDDGTGMSPDTLSRLFQPFFTTKEPGQGTGLGLALSRSIVLDHNGSIEVESEEGRGTSFTIRLPASRECPRQETPEIRDNGTRPADFTATVLVVDDEPSVRALINRILTSRGHAVVEAKTPFQALEEINAGKFDAVLMDIRMPGMSGRELYEKIIQIRPEMALKTVFITGDSSDISTMSFLRDNCLPFIAKPFDTAVLTGKVDAVLKGAA